VRAESTEEVGLQGVEFIFGDCLGGEIAGDIDIYYTSRVDIGWEEDGREFDLALLAVSCRVLLSQR